MSDELFHANKPSLGKPLKFDIIDCGDELTEEERELENAEATLEALLLVMGEFFRMDVDVNYMSRFFPEVFENSGGLHENMVEQNKNP